MLVWCWPCAAAGARCRRTICRSWCTARMTHCRIAVLSTSMLPPLRSSHPLIYGSLSRCARASPPSLTTARLPHAPTGAVRHILNPQDPLRPTAKLRAPRHCVAVRPSTHAQLLSMHAASLCPPAPQWSPGWWVPRWAPAPPFRAPYPNTLCWCMYGRRSILCAP